MINAEYNHLCYSGGHNKKPDVQDFPATRPTLGKGRPGPGMERKALIRLYFGSIGSALILNKANFLLICMGSRYVD